MEELLAVTGVAPACVVAVGDTPYDIAMGRAAGIATCAVTPGGCTAAELTASQPARPSAFAGLLPVVLRGHGGGR